MLDTKKWKGLSLAKECGRNKERKGPTETNDIKL